VARDVTEERVAQATLAEVEKRLEDGEALAHVGSWLWDVRTGAVQWSTEFHRIHGIEPLEFDGTFESHLAAIDARDREQVKGEMQRSVTLGRPFPPSTGSRGLMGGSEWCASGRSRRWERPARPSVCGASAGT
jgi:PAS domain-containing protein